MNRPKTQPPRRDLARRCWRPRRLPLRLEQLEDRQAPATSITIVPGLSGTGSLDPFLTGSGGAVLSTDGGAAPGTLSTGALSSVASTNNISVTAQTSITFNDLSSQ